MSDVQLDEASISQGHSNSSICDRMCMFMCKCNESGFEITNQSEYLASFQTYCCAPPRESDIYSRIVHYLHRVGKWMLTDACVKQTETIGGDSLGRRVLRADKRPSRFPGTEEFYPWDVSALNVMKHV